MYTCTSYKVSRQTYFGVKWAILCEIRIATFSALWRSQQFWGNVPTTYGVAWFSSQLFILLAISSTS